MNTKYLKKIRKRYSWKRIDVGLPWERWQIHDHKEKKVFTEYSAWRLIYKYIEQKQCLFFNFFDSFDYYDRISKRDKRAEYYKTKNTPPEILDTCPYCNKAIKPLHVPVSVTGYPYPFHRYCAIKMGADVEQDFEPKNTNK